MNSIRKGKYPQDGHRPYNSQPRPQVHEDTLRREEIQIERKEFLFALKENPRGRFIRIVEQHGNRFPQSIIVPASGLKEFHKMLCEMLEADASIPAKTSPPA
jgi:hypothetical protein